MKSSRSGFTIVEILITLVVMAALVALGTYAVGGMLVQARDRERESDVKVIANALEARYSSGNDVIISDGLTPKAQGNAGSYPGINEMYHMDGWSRPGWTPDTVPGGYRSKVLKGTSQATFNSPSNIYLNYICSWMCAPVNDTAQLNAAFGVDASHPLGIDRYIYAPADAAGNVCCCGNCVSFTMYWRSEADGQIKSLKSKHG